jgi:RNA polymerase sigma-70 factor (ECF subfamily)
MTLLAAAAADDDWLDRFHAGERAVLEAVYRDHFGAVERSALRLLDRANAETVVHEVFYRLISSEDMRRSFHGGSLAAWLTTVAHNLAVDFKRRHARETLDSDAVDRERSPQRIAERVEARILLERFRAEILPRKWESVFEARFVRQLDQREAARAVGISRTTLAYRELRIRSLLRKFVLEADA